MKVHEIMTAHAHCVGPDNNLVEAAGLMRQLDIGAVPVCDHDRVAGMITDRDITVRAVADGRDPNTTTVRDVMSPGIVWVFADQDVEEVARIMEHKQIRRLPVLNREKKLVGVVSLGDLAMTSSPAFSGLALREVSDSEQTRSHPGTRESEPMRGQTGAPRVPGQSRGAPKRSRRGGARGGKVPASASKTSVRGSARTTRTSQSRSSAKSRRGGTTATRRGSSSRSGGQPSRRGGSSAGRKRSSTRRSSARAAK